MSALAHLEILMASLNTGSPVPVIATPSADWKADYLDVIQNGPWRPVTELKGDKLVDRTPLPPRNLITSVQTQIIKVGRADKPTKRKRSSKQAQPYTMKIGVEIWTVPHEQIVRHKKQTQWRKFAQLRCDESFELTLQNAMNQGFIDKQFFKDTCSFAYQQMKPNDLYGIFHDATSGWHYHNLQFVHVNMDDPEAPVAHVYQTNNLLVSIPMSDVTEYTKAMDNGDRETHNGRVNL